MSGPIVIGPLMLSLPEPLVDRLRKAYSWGVMHPGQIVRWAVPAILLVATSCGTNRQFFAPTENPVAESASGHTAAQYAPAFDGLRWGEVRVWSEGAESISDDGPPRTVLHVGVEIENVTEQSIALDNARTRVEAVRLEDRTIESLEPVVMSSDLVAPPHGIRELDLRVELPGEVAATDIRSFRLHWWLLGPDGVAYEQHTPFQRVRRESMYDPWPWGYGRFGRGFAFGYGFYSPWCW